jgi:hypothetical protein
MRVLLDKSSRHRWTATARERTATSEVETLKRSTLLLYNVYCTVHITAKKHVTAYNVYCTVHIMAKKHVTSV